MDDKSFKASSDMATEGVDRQGKALRDLWGHEVAVQIDDCVFDQIDIPGPICICIGSQRPPGWW